MDIVIAVVVTMYVCAVLTASMYASDYRAGVVVDRGLVRDAWTLVLVAPVMWSATAAIAVFDVVSHVRITWR